MHTELDAVTKNLVKLAHPLNLNPNPLQPHLCPEPSAHTMPTVYMQYSHSAYSHQCVQVSSFEMVKRTELDAVTKDLVKLTQPSTPHPNLL